MSKSRVAIVIVNWKTPKLLAGCLDSIAKDSRRHELDLWVVDNNSGDESLAMLANDYPDVHVIANQENVGFARACNQVIRTETANAQYILLLNPDTEVVGDAVSILADYMDAHPECGAVGPKVLNTDGTMQLACRRAFPSPKAALYRLTYLSRLFPAHKEFAQYNMTYTSENEEVQCDVLSGAAMMVRSTTIEQIGLLEEAIFMFSEDVDWCWRIKKAGWTVVYYPHAQMYHYHGASSRLRPVGATWNFHKGMQVFYSKHLAPDHSLLFNLLVYTGIWTRCLIFCVVTYIASKLKPKTMPGLHRQSAPSPAAALNGRAENPDRQKALTGR